MEEVLSQSEIDLLLNAISTGELDTKQLKEENTQEKVRSYDFRRPNKFSKDQLRTLHMIHDNFARLLSNFLSAYLRTSAQIKIMSVDQLTYEDFINSVPTPTLMTVFSLPPLKGTGVLETNSAFVFPMIDLLFGGTGKMTEEVRELTEIEMSVLRKINARMLDNLVTAWADLFDISPQIESMETNPQYNQVISPNETIALVTLSSQIGNTQGYINLCLPYITLETVISKLSAHYWFSGSDQKDRDTYYKAMSKFLGKAPVTLTALCGETQLTVREFLQLETGDCLILDRSVDSDMDMLVEGHTKLKFQPGVKGNTLAAQITTIVNEGDVVDE
ncbi:flagellar motor switch protein FliM [Metallumcola ferriviriculae]|uniref:Flagellar motor switch protein FliM n=1 Tax=Metallumcola ferriviriculae TaxID=3039180 RepID=A0AAU0UTK7_9FIRM|nr:flagellar motor switch protein FliM [Desulfitibacteraceae bacterium MK1]